MTDKDQTTGQTAAAVGRSVALFRSNCTDASTRDSMGEIYFGKRKKILFGRKVVRLKPDQPDRRLRPCIWLHHVVVVVGATSSKSLTLRRFKSDGVKFNRIVFRVNNACIG